MSNHIPRRSGVGARFIQSAVKRRVIRRRWSPSVTIVDLGPGYKAIVREHPLRDGRGTTTTVLSDKDRTLAGKARRRARKAARRAVSA